MSCLAQRSARGIHWYSFPCVFVSCYCFCLVKCVVFFRTKSEDLVISAIILRQLRFTQMEEAALVLKQNITSSGEERKYTIPVWLIQKSQNNRLVSQRVCFQLHARGVLKNVPLILDAIFTDVIRVPIFTSDGFSLSKMPFSYPVLLLTRCKLT